MNTALKPRIALWFRYGPAEHSELFHAMPQIVEALARHCEVHYFGLKSDKPIPDLILKHAVIHHLPFRVNRQSTRDKLWKTLLWMLSFPSMGRRCRRLGIQAVYIDETVPLTAGLALRYFGPRVAMTVADFFVDVYSEGKPFLRPLARAIRRKDMSDWKKLPLIFTRVKNTKRYLVDQGFQADRIFPVYDPCDMTIYHPVDKNTARAKHGFSSGQFVLVHHGILHPNKGNDRIIRALAELKPTCPDLKYLLIGDGPDMPRLKELVRELHVEDMVVFTGWIKKLEDVNTALNAGDVGLVMRIGQKADDFHATGALVHSMACGLPVLAARLGGVSEIVAENQSGLLFDPGNMAEFKEKLLTLRGSAELRKRLGNTAHKQALTLFHMGQVTRSTVEPLLHLINL